MYKKKLREWLTRNFSFLKNKYNFKIFKKKLREWLKRNFSVLKNKYFFLHLLLATTTLVLLFAGWLKYLDSYTMHDKYIKTPDFNNMLIAQVDSIAKANNVRYEKIIISDRNRKKGIVVSQDPAPFTDVKKNRKIYLTINSLITKKVAFPNINDVTRDEAKTKLENLGLVKGEVLDSIPHMSKNVMHGSCNGVKIKTGEEIAEGTIIDFVVGDGSLKQIRIVPNLIEK